MEGLPKIDDVVYFFVRSDNHDYPDLCSGYVKRYKTDSHGAVCMLNIVVTNGYGVGYNHYIEPERCFTDPKDLLADIKQHINAETQSVLGCIYDW